jgi:hypothetical protein
VEELGESPVLEFGFREAKDIYLYPIYLGIFWICHNTRALGKPSAIMEAMAK